MVTKVVFMLACPVMPAPSTPAMPAIATTGISCTTETAPRIGLVSAAIAALTMVENSAIPIACSSSR